MTCASCGNGLSAGERFCGECGTPVAVATSAPARVGVPVRSVVAGKPGGGAGKSGSGAGEFSSPWGIAVDGNGVVWVADTWNHRFQRFGVG